MKKLRQGVGWIAVTALMGISPAAAHGPHEEIVSLAAAEGMESSPQPGAVVTIRTFQFQPAQLEVKAGAQVTWINQDDIRHTITSGTPETRDGRFDSSLAGKEAKFTFTFTQPGTYTYFCDRHQHMRGQIQVK